MSTQAKRTKGVEVTATSLPVARPPVVVVGVAEAAAILGMRRSNVAKFLERRGIEPYAERAAGRLWLREDVVRVKAEYDADAEKRAADERRRASALGLAVLPTVAIPKPPAEILGPTQRKALALLAEGRVRPSDQEGNSLRFALVRLERRGYARKVESRPQVYEITAAGRELQETLK